MSKKFAILVIAGGVILNNYVYLNDVVTDKYDGLIYVGVTSAAGIGVAVVAIALGVAALARGNA